MIRNMVRKVALLVLVGLGCSLSEARAGFSGSFGVNALSPMIIPVGSLAAATTFTITSMSTNGNTTGDFSGVPISTPFSGGTFTLGVSTGFTFSNVTFGSFTETAAPLITAVGMVNGVVTSETFLLVGTYMGGVVGTTALPASFTVSFTQDGGPGNSLSASGTLTIPPTVPEPASVAMLGLGLAGSGGLALRRRAAK